MSYNLHLLAFRFSVCIYIVCCFQYLFSILTVHQPVIRCRETKNRKTNKQTNKTATEISSIEIIEEFNVENAFWFKLFKLFLRRLKNLRFSSVFFNSAVRFDLFSIIVVIKKIEKRVEILCVCVKGKKARSNF